MKLRNLLLTAALFLTAGIASAAVVHDNFYDEGNFIGEDVYYLLDGYVYQDTDSETRHFRLKDVVLTTSDDFPYEVYLERSGAGSDSNQIVWTKELVSGTAQTLKLSADTYLGSKLILKVVNSSTEEYMISSYLNSYNYTDVGIGYFTQSANSIVFNDGNGNTATVTFGSPLPTPVITLLIALGFGAAFVMYRNRKQVKA